MPLNETYLLLNDVINLFNFVNLGLQSPDVVSRKKAPPVSVSAPYIGKPAFTDPA
jgi:hypothetical protein